MDQGCWLLETQQGGSLPHHGHVHGTRGRFRPPDSLQAREVYRTCARRSQPKNQTSYQTLSEEIPDRTKSAHFANGALSHSEGLAKAVSSWSLGSTREGFDQERMTDRGTGDERPTVRGGGGGGSAKATHVLTVLVSLQPRTRALSCIQMRKICRDSRGSRSRGGEGHCAATSTRGEGELYNTVSCDENASSGSALDPPHPPGVRFCNTGFRPMFPSRQEVGASVEFGGSAQPFVHQRGDVATMF